MHQGLFLTLCVPPDSTLQRSHPVQDEVVVQVAETIQQHSHVALDVLRLQDDALLHEDGLEVGLTELEHQVDVLVDEEHIH